MGIYGVVGYAVTRRSREIGIRIAMGASRTRIMVGVLRQMAGPVTGGVVLGAAGALALGRTLQPFLFHVRPADPLTFAAIAGLLLLVCVSATLVPARRAARMDPVRVLGPE